MTTAVSPFNGKSVTFQNWGAPACTSNPFLCFANPLVLQGNVYSSEGEAQYVGGILEVRKRFSNHFSIMASYTYSKATDDSTDFNSDYGPVNNANLNLERGLSSFDQRHKIVFSSVLQSPWHNRFLAGFELTPIISYNSEHPFNVLADGTDINGDRHYTNDRPLGVSRNTGVGPNYFNWDMRLSRQFHFGERASLTLTAESFNLLNRTNYATVNNEVPTANGFSSLTAFQGGTSFLPNSPLAFTSDYNRRQFQLGGRFTF
jgi:hypothetical protein